MKKLFFAVVAILSSCGCYAQKINQYMGTPNTVTNVRGSMVVDTVFVLPYYDTASLGSPVREGSIIYQASAKSPFVFDGTYWQNLFLGNVSGTLATRIDSIIQAIAVKLDPDDTLNISARIDNKKNLAESDLSQPDSTSRTYNAHMGQLAFNFGGAGGKSASLLLEPNNLSWFASQDGHGVMFQNGSTGFQILGNSGSGWSNGIATFAYGGKITFPGYPNNAARDSVFAPFSDGSLGMRYMPPADSVLKKSELLDTLAKHAVNIHAPLVYNPADTSISADTSSAETAVALRWWVKDFVAANAGSGGGITELGTGWGLASVNDSTYRVDTTKVPSLQALKDTAAAIRIATGVSTPDLDAVLTVGATSSIGITVGDVNTGSITLSNPTYASLSYLGTDAAGQIIEASAPPVLGDIAINSSASTAYTLSLADKNRINSFTASSDVTVTVPTNTSVAFPTGTRLIFLQSGTGKVTFAGASGVTVGSLNAIKRTAGQYALVEIVKTATNTWVLFGALQ